MQETINPELPAYLQDAIERWQHMSEEELHAEGVRLLNELRAQVGGAPVDDFFPVDEHGNIIPEEPTPKPPLARRIREAWRALQGK